MGSPSVGQDWATKQQQPNLLLIRTDTADFKIPITHYLNAQFSTQNYQTCKEPESMAILQENKQTRKT